MRHVRLRLYSGATSGRQAWTVKTYRTRVIVQQDIYLAGHSRG
jgi:hypothetical protein